MMNRKRYLHIFFISLMLILVGSFGVYAQNNATQNGEAASAWTIPQYGEKAYNTMKAAMDAYDPLAETAPGLDATAAVLMDADSGMILYEVEPDGLRYPASITKLVTLLVALDAVEEGKVSFSDEVPFSEAAVTQEASYLKYEPGTTDTLERCLEMMIVFSANDAAYAVAEYIGGTVEQFVAMMNEKAAELGMTASHFMNPNGLHDPDHWSTARDIATLCRYCANNEEVMRFASMESTALKDGTVVYNTNKLLFWYEGANGLKTGTTLAAGHCLAATAERNGMRLISVTLGSKLDYTHYIDGMKLLEYGFANYTTVKAVEKGAVYGETTVLYGKEDTVELAAAEDIVFPVKNGETAEPEIVTEIAESVEGPAEAGIDGGDVIVMLNGAEIGRCDLVTVSEIHDRSVWQWLKDFFSALFRSI